MQADVEHCWYIYYEFIIDSYHDTVVISNNFIVFIELYEVQSSKTVKHYSFGYRHGRSLDV